MAILNLTIDTQTYECKADVNGVPISDIDCVSVYNFGDYDRPRYSFSLCTYQRVDDVRFTTTVSASDKSTPNAVVSSLASDLFETKSMHATAAQIATAEWYSKGKV